MPAPPATPGGRCAGPGPRACDHRAVTLAPDPPDGSDDKSARTTGDAAGGRPALQLHGSPRVRTGGGDGRALERKHAALLAWLAREGPTPRARLAGLLWPDAGEARARANLRQRLLKLRQDAGALVRDDGSLLALADDVLLEPPEPPSAPLLGTLDYDDCDALAQWLDGQREADRARHRRRWLARVRESAQAGRLDEALVAADELLAADRESEEAYRVLMEVYYLRGDHAAALSAWDRCREMLRTLYGVLPSPPTQQLGHTILAAAQAADVAARDWAAAGSPSARRLPPSVLRPPRLVGRDAALRVLADGWRRGDVLLVAGEAGLGKSRLLGDFLAAPPDRATPAADGVTAHAIASARPGDAVLPHASLSRLLLALQAHWPAVFVRDGEATPDAREAARLLPQLAAALGLADVDPVRTDYARTQALLAVGRLVDAAGAAGCRALALDDLHFADDASLAALRVLAAPETVQGVAGGEGARPRFALAWRPDETGPEGDALVASLQAGGHCTRVDLAPLDAAEAALLLTSLGPLPPGLDGRAEALWQHVGGNPAFLLESVKLLLSGDAAADAAGDVDAPLPLPAGQRAVIERRIALLSPPARHLAQLAAVAGNGYSIGLAAAALACTPLALAEPLRELELRQVFYGRHFVHDVVGSVVRTGVPAAVAEFMHRFVAEHLVARHGDDPAHVATIATHWAEAGEPLRAARAFRLASDAARDAALATSQADLLDRAIAVLEPVAAAQPAAQQALFDAVAERATVYEAAGFGAAREAMIQRLEALTGDDRQRLLAMNLRQGMQADLAQPVDEDALRPAIDRARALGDEALAWSLSRTLAWHWAMNGRGADGLALLDLCAPYMDGAATAAERVSYRIARSSVHAFHDDLADAIAEGKLAIDAALAAKDWTNALPALSNVGLMHHWRGELAQARDALVQGRALRDRHFGRGGAGIKLDIHLGAVLAALGESEAAEAMLCGARDEIARWTDGVERQTELLLADNHLARLLLDTGRGEAAAAVLARDDSGVADRYRGRRLALRLQWQRRFGAAVDPALLAETRELAERMASPFNRGVVDLELARHGPPAEALAMARAVAASAAAAARPGLRLHALALAAASAREAGDGVAANALAAEAESLRAVCAPFELTAAECDAMLQRARGA